ncbi:MAG: hypothetical protein ACI9QL_002042 [Candidatus Omnitrophota bacterium]|jgi:hypothetical protein
MSDHRTVAPPTLSSMIPIFVFVCLLAALGSYAVKQSHVKGRFADAIKSAGYEHVEVGFNSGAGVLEVSGHVDTEEDVAQILGLVSELNMELKCMKGGVRAEGLHIGNAEPADAGKPVEVASAKSHKAKPVEQGHAASEKAIPLATLVDDDGHADHHAKANHDDHGHAKADENDHGEHQPLKSKPAEKKKQAGAKQAAAQKGAAGKAQDSSANAMERLKAIAAALKGDDQLNVKIIRASQHPYTASDIVRKAQSELDVLKGQLVKAGVSESQIELVVRANLTTASKVERYTIEFHLY